jgi:hypothetical protein
VPINNMAAVEPSKTSSRTVPHKIVELPDSEVYASSHGRAISTRDPGSSGSAEDSAPMRLLRLLRGGR